MYCRKCGEKIADNVSVCPKCGAEIVLVKQRSYQEKYDAQKKAEKQQKSKPTKKENIVENRYLSYAVVTALFAFVLSIIPWPASWGIGTSLWMKIIILVIALLADYHCVKAKQIDTYNIKHSKDYNGAPALTVATVIAVITTLVSTFSLFMG